MKQQIRRTCEAIAQTLGARGFRTQTIDHYWRYWDKLLQYLSDNGIATYTPKAGLDFLLDVYGITVSTGLTREQRWIVRSVQYLNDYLDFGTVFLAVPPVSTTNSLTRYGGDLDAFKRHQQKRHSVSASTLSGYDKYIGKFLLYLEGQNVTDLSTITTAQLHACCKMIAKQSDGVAHNMACSIRVFLVFAQRRRSARRPFRKDPILHVQPPVQTPVVTQHGRNKRPADQR